MERTEQGLTMKRELCGAKFENVVSRLQQDRRTHKIKMVAR